jgi:hypothetical protein
VFTAAAGRRLGFALKDSSLTRKDEAALRLAALRESISNRGLANEVNGLSFWASHT